ncbi:SDR family oxidoreductase [Desulfovibrio inopinatus]|uniref:SDR family oxidoreductase n=1 Tax=Desulfovibrio inopinatus TaxID=102109 RepID=UPI0003FB610B|nr:SDR family oxidoreductase [Desulfovibrio inopinatus]
MSPRDERPILVTGATGYVGGRIVPRLLQAGWTVRAIGRSLDKLLDRPWAHLPGVECFAADVMDADALQHAAAGCCLAYYLVHSMNPQNQDFARADLQAAQNMAHAAAEAGLERIIYLGGLGDEDDDLSTHLRSRLDTARALQSGPVPVTFFRAAMLLGSGSASFEILRYLTEHLPIMITPKWVRTKSQPIAVSNVLNYLVDCLDHPETIGQTFDIGGPDIVSYEELFHIYAEEAGLGKRFIIPVPVLSPKLSSYWVQFVTPIPASLAVPLISGLRNEAVCRENRIREIIPQTLLPCRETIRLALERTRQHNIESCWSDAGFTTPPEWMTCGDAAYAGGTMLECGFRAEIDADPDAVWPILTSIGGQTGWYAGDLLWKMRGWMDKLAGGVGLNRGRRDPHEIRQGDALDFWRVLALEKPHLLKLQAEMRMPGEAMLEFRLDPLGEHRCQCELHSYFLPRGIAGLAYWYGTYPFHVMIFSNMLKNIARASGSPLKHSPQRFTPTFPRKQCRIQKKS